MATSSLPNRAASHLRRLCLDIPGRGVGSAGNQAATAFFAETLASYGFAIETPTFPCMDWVQDGASLLAGGPSFEVFPSPYSRGCRAAATLVAAATVDELEAVEATGRVLLVRGELAREQLMPKSFTWYNPAEHQRIVRLLEEKRPLAIVAATGRNPEMAGALYPFPLIEDGDVYIPSVYMTEEEGARLAEHVGREVSLEIRAERRPSTGCNVVARKGAGRGGRTVLFAHIDAKIGTPGAIDNAAGVVTLLLLAELLAEHEGRLGVEIVAMNGEDYYANPGEKLYLSRNEGHFDEIVLGINLDGLGYREGETAYSLYECPAEIADVVRETFAGHDGIVEGPPWYQGDHALFLLHRRPALAITSARALELVTGIIHTQEDRPEIVDGARLAVAAQALRDLIVRMDRTGA